ncbi:MAG TPA: YbhB/YbcL family Raf kinase inhibitor-like protein [Phenylobacterium sp.]|jgi:para-nitrobenzyl esterase|uniref:YbhB/YbcL family Raf kinase inhibitor-like protein n=1 Tax=Phenylobacterium sp. TaxID=1871053 RepID=UPI002D753750|nr:YbhB/YbcL family Raf kinase inhibitor-like protein [Phenylobacterium sp.]HZZ69801.1 YbhB/YbcL family Raf kinase inhibitor-like protein [Phenylobacterium sp.]
MNMPIRVAAPIALGLAVLTLACAPAALAQVHRSNPGDADAKTVLDTMPGKGKLTVTTPAFKGGEQIPFENTQYRTNTFPGLSWSKGPAGTKSYALIMQDSTLILRGAPILHWTLFNIPAGVTRLDAGMAPTGNPPGSAYGPNYKGASQPYTGPRTPPGPGDMYHFEIFALDTTLPDEAKSDFAALTKAMEGHVLASGEVVGHGIADPDAPPPAPRPAPPKP